MSFNRTNHNHQYNNFSRQSHSRPAVAGWRSPQRPPPSHGQAPLLGASSRQPDSAQVHRSCPGPLRAADSIFNLQTLPRPPPSSISLNDVLDVLDFCFHSGRWSHSARVSVRLSAQLRRAALQVGFSRSHLAPPCKSIGFLGFHPLGPDGLNFRVEVLDRCLM